MASNIHRGGQSRLKGLKKSQYWMLIISQNFSNLSRLPILFRELYLANSFPLTATCPLTFRFTFGAVTLAHSEPVLVILECPEMSICYHSQRSLRMEITPMLHFLKLINTVYTSQYVCYFTVHPSKVSALFS